MPIDWIVHSIHDTLIVMSIHVSAIHESPLQWQRYPGFAPPGPKITPGWFYHQDIPLLYH